MPLPDPVMTATRSAMDVSPLFDSMIRAIVDLGCERGKMVRGPALSNATEDIAWSSSMPVLPRSDWITGTFTT